MENNNINESSTIEKEKVKLNREWSFWENYDSKNKNDKDYSKLLKEIYTFDNIISFWQFWNNYPGSDAKRIYFDGEHITYFFEDKFRINAMNLFEKGIRPEWEDVKNKKGQILYMEYDVKENLEGFLKAANEYWLKLICMLIGETIPSSHYINGIRFVDKTRFGKNVLFRYEVWVNSSIEKESLDELNKHLGDIFKAKVNIKNM